MKETVLRIFALLFSALAVFAGCAALLALRFLPSITPTYWVLPIVILLFAGWYLARVWGGKVALAVGLFAVLAAYLTVAKVWPPTATAPSSVGAVALPAAPLVTEPLTAISLDVPELFRRGPFATSRILNAPAGFHVSVFAAGLDAPRMLAVGPEGDIYVSVPKEGKVLVLPDRDRNGVSDRSVVFADGLDRPHGLAFRGRELYIAETGRLLIARDGDGDLRADSVQVVSTDLPPGRGHWTRSVVLGPDDRLYVAAGSSCNVCVEEDWRRAAVMRFAPEGGKATLFARGLRNSVGLAFHPRSGELWGSDNGRDLLGDDLPPEEINRIVEGGDYGWPACYGDRIPDPEFGSPQDCRETNPPAVTMPAHSAPLGIAFGDGLDWPAPYHDLLYVAFHGSWNRTVPTGYKLVAIPFRDGRPAGPVKDFVTGWLEGSTAWGRPVAPAVGSDGALYLSDDRAGAIYRITWGRVEANRQTQAKE